MNHKVENFINLFSDDRKILYSALIEKKDWILSKYYIELDFIPEKKEGLDIYPKVFALLEGGIYFTPCFSQDDNENMLVSINSHLDLFDREHIPFKKGKFYVGLNFKKIDDKVYRELFPNFYPKFNEGEFEKTDNELINAFAKFMIGNNGEYVILLPTTLMLNGVYPLEIAFEILFKESNVTKEQKEALEEFSSRMNIPLTEVKND